MKITTGKKADVTKDDRRNKRYYRRVDADASIDLNGRDIEGAEIFGSGVKHRRYFGTTLFHDRIGRMVSNHTNFKEEIKESFIPEGATDVNVGIFSGNTGYVTVNISYHINADRPSDIISEEEALATINTDELGKRFSTAVEDTITFLERRAAELKTLEQTNRLSQWMADEAQERATKKMKYQEKLEELTREYKEAVAALKEKATQETVNEAKAMESQWEDTFAPEARDAEYTEESISNAPKFWNRYIEEPSGGTLGGFPSTTVRQEPKVLPEDLGYDE